jgi:hypothetical protein
MQWDDLAVGGAKSYVIVIFPVQFIDRYSILSAEINFDVFGVGQCVRAYTFLFPTCR